MRGNKPGGGPPPLPPLFIGGERGPSHPPASPAPPGAPLLRTPAISGSGRRAAAAGEAATERAGRGGSAEAGRQGGSESAREERGRRRGSGPTEPGRVARACGSNQWESRSNGCRRLEKETQEWSTSWWGPCGQKVVRKWATGVEKWSKGPSYWSNAFLMAILQVKRYLNSAQTVARALPRGRRTGSPCPYRSEVSVRPKADTAILGV
jgi:hypothetical protein